MCGDARAMLEAWSRGRRHQPVGAGRISRSTQLEGLDQSDEANFSTEQPKAPQDARIPHPHAHDRRAQRTEASPPPRPRAPRRIKKGLSKERFEAIFAEGRRASGRLLTVRTLPGEGRLGIATAKKIGCHARRNRARCRVREAIRSLEIASSLNLDWIVTVSPSGANAGMEELKAEVRVLFDAMVERWAGESASS